MNFVAVGECTFGTAAATNPGVTLRALDTIITADTADNTRAPSTNTVAITTNCDGVAACTLSTAEAA